MAARTWQGRWGRASDEAGLVPRAALALGFCALFFAWLLLGPREGTVAATVGNLGQILGAALALLLCYTPRPGPNHRRATIPISLGIVTFLIGQTIWTYYEGILGRALPTPSWADVAFLSGYPLVLCGILLLPQRALSRAQRVRVVLDGLLVLVAGLTFSWYFLLGPLLLNGQGSTLQKAVGLAYPLGDLLHLGCLLLIANRAAPELRGATRFLAVGLATMIAANSIFLQGTLAGTYASGAVTDVAWPLAHLLCALGIRAVGFVRTTEAAPATQTFVPPTLARTLIPFVLFPATVGLVIAARQSQNFSTLERGVSLGGVTLLGLLMLRQALALIENQRLYRALHAAYGQLEAHSAKLATLTTADALTGLPNHRALLEALDREVEQARRRGRSFAVLFLDLDHFKALNDTHGHATGDAALREFGRLARGCMRMGDLLGRWGGEEFLALLPETGPDEGLIVAERIRAAVAAHHFGASGLRLTCSLGLATFPLHGGDRDAVVAAADGAMYAAKRLGRDQVQLADSAAVLALREGSLGREETASLGMVEALLGLAEERTALGARAGDPASELAASIARELGCTAEEARLIGLAARLRDIGQVALPDAVLQKPGRLVTAEWAHIHRHPAIGAGIVGRVPTLRTLAPLIRGHHERWDGRGYPDGLDGEAIPLGARIIAVADAYTAMAIERPYRRARRGEDALAELRACAGSQFDPTIVAALEEVVGALALAGD